MPRRNTEKASSQCILLTCWVIGRAGHSFGLSHTHTRVPESVYVSVWGCECVRLATSINIALIIFSLALCLLPASNAARCVLTWGEYTCMCVCVCVSKQQVSRAYCALMIIFLFIFMLPKYNFGSRYYITVYLALDKFLLFSSCCSSCSAVFVFVLFFFFAVRNA